MAVLKTSVAANYDGTIHCAFSSQRVLHAHRRESQAANQDGETVPIPIPGSFSGRVPQIIELVTVSCNGVVFITVKKDIPFL